MTFWKVKFIHRPAGRNILLKQELLHQTLHRFLNDLVFSFYNHMPQNNSWKYHLIITINDSHLLLNPLLGTGHTEE